MARRPSTVFGEPLSDESRQLVHDVRRALTQPRHANVSAEPEIQCLGPNIGIFQDSPFRS